MPDEETTSTHMLNPFKIIKMINGDDVICKIAEEYTDAFVIEYPMSIVKQQSFDNEHAIVEHTGLQRWMNYTHDATIVIMKEKILSFEKSFFIFLYIFFGNRIIPKLTECTDSCGITDAISFISFS